MGNRQSLQNERDQRAVSNILRLGLRLECITEEQKLKVETQVTVKDKKLLLFEFLENMEDEEKASILLSVIRFINDRKLIHSLDVSELLLDEFAKIPQISVEKVQEFEGEIDSKNFDVEKVSVNLNIDSPAIETKAILLSPVIRCIFKYLDLGDLKNCRYVCREWNSVAQPILRSRSKIDFPKYDWDDNIFLLPQFFETFSGTLESMPFTAFELNHISDCPFNVGELNNFFQRQKKTLRELRINFLHVTDGDSEILGSVDVTPWIIQSPIAEETKPHTKFDVFGSFTLTRVIVQNNSLANVKELILYSCQVNLEDKIKCRPIVLKLNCVAFFKNGIKLPEICVNDYFHFSKLRHLDLRYFEDHESSNITKLSLNLTGKLKLECLSLGQVTVVNWRTCGWQVNKLDLTSVEFIEETEMQIQELDFLINKIDICCLPQSIQKLTIDKFTVEDCFCTRPVILRNLQSLSLNLYDNSFSIISEFVQCPSLNTLHLASSVGDQLEINSDWIPNTVKILKLDRVSITWADEKKNLKLNKLVLIDNPVPEVKNICSALNHIKELIVRFPEGVSPDGNIFNFFLVRNSIDFWKTIAIGPFHWENISFETSSVRHFVDRKAEYYTMENQIVKAFDSFFTFREYENIQD